MKQAPQQFPQPYGGKNYALTKVVDNQELPQPVVGTLLVSLESMAIVEMDQPARSILADIEKDYEGSDFCPIPLRDVFFIGEIESRQLRQSDPDVKLVCRCSYGPYRPELSAEVTFWAHCNVFRIRIRDSSFSVEVRKASPPEDKCSARNIFLSL
jgi:hypothetical protein